MHKWLSRVALPMAVCGALTGGMAVLSGCEGGQSTSFTPSAANLSGRSYSSTVGLNGSLRAFINLFIGSSNSIGGTMILDDGRAATSRVTVRSINLAGDLNSITGVFSLAGNTTDYDVRLTGSLFTGQIRVTVNGTSYTGTLTQTTGGNGNAGTTTGGNGTNGTTTGNTTTNNTTTGSTTGTTTGTPVGNVFNSAYFPLGQGDSRTYNVTTQFPGESETNSRRTERVSGQTMISGQTVPRLENYDENNVLDGASYIAATTNGIAFFGTDAITNGQVVSAPRYSPPLVYPFSLQLNVPVPYSHTFSETDDDGGTVNVTVNGTVTYQGRESVTVPAGTFDTIRLEINSTGTFSGQGFTSTITNRSIENIAENIGFVRGRATATTSTGGGTTTSEEVLVSGNVGGRPIGNGR